MLHEAVHPLLRCDSPGLGGTLDLGPVLIDPGQVPHVIATLATPARENITGGRCVGMADVGGVVDVIDRRRDVVGGHGPDTTFRLRMSAQPSQGTAQHVWPEPQRRTPRDDAHHTAQPPWRWPRGGHYPR